MAPTVAQALRAQEVRDKDTLVDSWAEVAGALPGALERAFSSGKPAVVNVKTRPIPSPVTDYIIKVKGKV